MDPTLATAPSNTPGLSQQQMTLTLQNLMSNIEDSYKKFQDQSTITQNAMVLQKNDVLRQLFDLFQTQGVDPSNPQAVRDLLDKVQQNNPDTYRQIEQALQQIMGGDQTPPAPVTSTDTSVAANTQSNTGDQVNTPTPAPTFSPTISPTTTKPVAPITTPTTTQPLPTQTPVYGQPSTATPDTNTPSTTGTGSSTQNTINSMRSGGGGNA